MLIGKCLDKRNRVWIKEIWVAACYYPLQLQITLNRKFTYVYVTLWIHAFRGQRRVNMLVGVTHGATPKAWHPRMVTFRHSIPDLNQYLQPLTPRRLTSRPYTSAAWVFPRFPLGCRRSWPGARGRMASPDASDAPKMG